MYLKVKYKVPIKIATIITEIINIVANAIKLFIKISNTYKSSILINIILTGYPFTEIQEICFRITATICRSPIHINHCVTQILAVFTSFWILA